MVQGWADKVPRGFRFALKLPQALTPEGTPQDGALAEFCQRALLLGDKLGPVLVQLGPDFGPPSERWDSVARFLAHLPRGPAGQGGQGGQVGQSVPRWAIEFRQRGWVGPKLLELLARHAVALALVEGRGVRRDEMMDLAIHPTADFAYVRWMGSGTRLADFSTVQVNRDRELSVWAVALAALAARVPAVFGYFSNHFQGHAPASAREMQRLIGVGPVDPEKLRSQTSLF